MQVVDSIRVSADDQAREGVSPTAQQAKINAYATVNDSALREVVREAGVSAKSLRRLGLSRVLGLITVGEVGAVVVYKFDRLTRSVGDLDRLLRPWPGCNSSARAT